MLNQSDFLTAVRMDLGLYGLSLPFEDANSVIMETIRLKTLPTFSTFVPYRTTQDIKFNDLVSVKTNYEESIYELPDSFGGLRLLSVLSVKPKNTLIGNGYFSPMFGESYDTYDALLMTQANANLYSAAAPPFIFKYEYPNLLYIYNMNSMATEVRVELALQHSDNLATITNTSWESFYELAIIDIKQFMYNTLKHYRDMQTAYGNITLKIDDWENAANERKELIERWRGVYHLDLPAFVVI